MPEIPNKINPKSKVPQRTQDPGQKMGGSTPSQKPPPAENSPQKNQEPKTPPKKKTPAQKKDDRFKYEMKYVNGGFNNGVQVKPDRDGKALLEIAIYGGGEKKTLTIHPLPKPIQKLVSAYELSTNQNSNSPEITGELQKYFSQVQELLNSKVIEIFKEADEKVKLAIKETFKTIGNKNGI